MWCLWYGSTHPQGRIHRQGRAHEGSYSSQRLAHRPGQFPLIPGHETVGVIAAMGKDVKGFKLGERVVADNSELCGECFYCRRGQALLCEHFEAHGVTSECSLCPTVEETLLTSSPQWTEVSPNTVHILRAKSSPSRISAMLTLRFSNRHHVQHTAWRRLHLSWAPVC